MKIEHDITVEVETTYREIEGLRFAPGSWSDKVAEWHRIRATSKIEDDGSLGPIYLYGHGHYVKKDGTVGLQDANMRFGRNLSELPEEWRERITSDLQTLAHKVTVSL